MRERIIQSIEEGRVIAILRGVPVGDILQTAQALYAGGIRLVEVTFDQSGRIPAGNTCESISKIASEFAGRMFVGAGTVVTMEQVGLAGRAGAQFLISPNTDEAIIRGTVERGMVSIPGALTPTEIMAAHACGADFVKIFPAGSMGAGYVKAVCAPINSVKMLAVGGVSAKNAREFIDAGCRGVGVGGNLANLKWIAAGEFDKLEAAARELVQSLKEGADCK